MTASTSVLSAIDDPCPELVALTDHLYVLLRDIEKRKKEPKPNDDRRYRETLLAFVAAIATIALSQIPPKHGKHMAFGEARYIRSRISATHMRTIRDGLAKLGLIVPGGWFFNRERRSSSYPTRIRHTAEFTTMARQFGMRLNLLIRPPVKVIDLSRGVQVAMPDDVAARAATLQRYNGYISQFDLTLPQAAWADLFHAVIKGGTNGKGDRLVKGYNDARIYLTCRFAETYDRGGRAYDPFYQNMPKRFRKRLLIDGKATVELDFSRIHPTIIFAEKGLELDRDPYDVPGFEDMIEAGKVTFNRLLNSRTRRVPYRPKEDAELFKSADHFKRYRGAMIAHLEPIADTFCRDFGARLQKRDSELALRILERCMDIGVPVYPVHDSFIILTGDENEVREIMHSEFKEMFGVDCVIK